MLQLLKRLKPAYALYNFFQKQKLEHNLPLYRKFGLRKNYWSPVSSKDFAHIAHSELSQPATHEQLVADQIIQSLSEENRSSILDFSHQGYAILRNYFDEAKVDAANEAIDIMLRDGTVTFTNGNKIMFAIRKSALLKEMATDPKLNHILSLLLGTDPVLFQSINFLSGSEQETHSDSIHMTTFPLGRLIAVWVALEDINEDNGPLHYYPGSHQLPYYLNSDYNNEGNGLLIGDKSYHEYEMMIEKKIAASGIPKKIFRAKKGDLLIWHANLFHGGEPHHDKTKTRKSMVFHYFGGDAICYHEITQRPALMERE